MKFLLLSILSLFTIDGKASDEFLESGVYRSIEGSPRSINVQRRHDGKLEGKYIISDYTSEIYFKYGQGLMYYKDHADAYFIINPTAKDCMEISWQSNKTILSDKLCIGEFKNSINEGIYHSVKGTHRSISVERKENGILEGVTLSNGYRATLEFQNGEGSLKNGTGILHFYFIKKISEECIKITWHKMTNSLESEELCIRPEPLIRDFQVGTYRSIQGSSRAIDFKRLPNEKIQGTYLLNNFSTLVDFDKDGNGIMPYNHDASSFFYIFPEEANCIRIEWFSKADKFSSSDKLCIGEFKNSLKIGTYKSKKKTSRSIKIIRKSNGSLEGTYLKNNYTSAISFQNGKGEMKYGKGSNQLFRIEAKNDSCIRISWTNFFGNRIDDLCL